MHIQTKDKPLRFCGMVYIMSENRGRENLLVCGVGVFAVLVRKTRPPVLQLTAARGTVGKYGVRL